MALFHNTNSTNTANTYRGDTGAGKLYTYLYRGDMGADLYMYIYIHISIYIGISIYVSLSLSLYIYIYDNIVATWELLRIYIHS